jgi:hypothetical protein
MAIEQRGKMTETDFRSADPTRPLEMHCGFVVSVGEIRDFNAMVGVGGWMMTGEL